MRKLYELGSDALITPNEAENPQRSVRHSQHNKFYKVYIRLAEGIGVCDRIGNGRQLYVARGFP